jgi:hypothetical protein
MNYPNNGPNKNEIFGEHSDNLFGIDSGSDIEFGRNSGNTNIMINFLLGLWSADLLFSIILYFKKEIVLNLDKNVYLFAIIVDIFLLSLLLFLKYVRKLMKS